MSNRSAPIVRALARALGVLACFDPQCNFTLLKWFPLQHFENMFGLAVSIVFVPPATLSSCSSLSSISLDWLLLCLLMIASNVAPAVVGRVSASSVDSFRAGSDCSP
jgi:hypothetical protein